MMNLTFYVKFVPNYSDLDQFNRLLMCFRVSAYNQSDMGQILLIAIIILQIVPTVINFCTPFQKSFVLPIYIYYFLSC